MRRRCASDPNLALDRAFSAMHKGFFALTFLLTAGFAAAQEQSADTVSREVKDIFERSRKAVVKVRAVDEHGKLAGTGFFIDPTGTLYTAFSVGAEADDITVEFEGKEVPAHPLWALSWSAFGAKSPAAALGDVLVFVRSGGGHVGL